MPHPWCKHVLEREDAERRFGAVISRALRLAATLTMARAIGNRQSLLGD